MKYEDIIWVVTLKIEESEGNGDTGDERIGLDSGSCERRRM